MGFGSVVRSIVPPQTRAWLRRSRAVNRMLAAMYGGVRSAPHPHSPYTFYFDGYRNLGWAAGGLKATEHEEFDFVRSILQKRSCNCAWDVGANVGSWTLFFAGVSPTIPRIISFEPDIVNGRFLRMNVENNRLGDRVTIKPLAVSSEVGQATFFADGMTGSTGGLEKEAGFTEEHYGVKRQEVTVSMTTVDTEVDAGTPPPQFIKIDVEGHELSVLQGAGKTLERYHPAMMIEVTRHHGEVAALLRGLGYRLVNPATGQPLDRPDFNTACLWGDSEG